MKTRNRKLSQTKPTVTKPPKVCGGGGRSQMRNSYTSERTLTDEKKKNAHSFRMPKQKWQIIIKKNSWAKYAYENTSQS